MKGGGIVAEYTLTTDQVRNAFRQTGVWLPRISYPEYGAEFDRWLKEHDLEVAKNAYKRGYVDGLETGTADWA